MLDIFPDEWLQFSSMTDRNETVTDKLKIKTLNLSSAFSIAETV